MSLEVWASLVGFFLPALVAVVNRDNWSPLTKALIALVSSVAGGTITAELHGQFTGENWIAAMGTVLAVSQGFYHTWWKNSSITDWIEQSINIFISSRNRNTGAHNPPVHTS